MFVSIDKFIIFVEMSKDKNIKGKDLFVFVRFGGLNLKKQKGYTNKSDATYHSPPTSRGIYAMPKIVQEFFLVSGINRFQPGIMPKAPKYPMGGSPEDIEKYDQDCQEYEKKWKKNMSAIRKEFSKRDGNIWSHLGDYIPNNEVIDRKGSWVKTSIKDWVKAFSRMSLFCRYGDQWFASKSINDVRGVVGFYSKDHCEVFFDEKV